jgi:hypothetical protein
MQKEITFYLTTPAIDVLAIDTALSAMNECLPTRPLIYQIAGGGALRKVPEPALYAYEEMSTKNHGHLCNGQEDSPVTLTAQYVEARHVPDGQPLLDLMITVPQTPAFLDRGTRFLQTLCPAIDALFGEASAPQTGGRIARDFVGVWKEALSAAVPVLIGWLNYWSAETCHLLAFDLDGPKQRLFTEAHPCHGGGVVLRLTEDPLDLDRPEHLAALMAAYDAFPVIPRKAMPRA